MNFEPRFNWSAEEVYEIYRQPFPDLIFNAASIHRQFYDPSKVQFCTLLSIKTGGCPEDCGYCPQSAHFSTPVGKTGLLSREVIIDAALKAKEEGSTRFCMGAAWREIKDGEDFNQVLQIVREVALTDMEVCVTLGMLTSAQAEKLKKAGLTAYNHNIDTSEQYYPNIITTRTYQDRLDTIRHVIHAGISVCSGGILGMGESIRDRCAMLAQLARITPHPESVPINLLVPSQGTPLENASPVDPLELARTVATARILMPVSRIRLSAGRLSLSREAQALCFLAGANSLFSGDKLLTTPNPEVNQDARLLSDLGMTREEMIGAKTGAQNQ
ncbi:MAG: biotin synthase BioB [Nitrospirae bacterium]|nr:biotin synthase BioB [Nitrospirota bacterium]MBI3352482.1 biotin synthase BioB [Nitrospirota bacterium]